MAAKAPLYGPRVDHEALNGAAMAIRHLVIRECQDLANKLNYVAGAKTSALDASLVRNTIDLCTTVMRELAAQSDPSWYVSGNAIEDRVNAEMISDVVQARIRARELVEAARDQLREMVGTLLTV